MRRREVIALFGWAAASPPALRAQPGKVWRIGMLETIDMIPNLVNLDTFRKGLREHGYVEDQTRIPRMRSGVAVLAAMAGGDDRAEPVGRFESQEPVVALDMAASHP